jgi:hypothetical protein
MFIAGLLLLLLQRCFVLGVGGMDDSVMLKTFFFVLHKLIEVTGKVMLPIGTGMVK